MAFLATEDRFGPDLDRYRRGEPDPCTYTAQLVPADGERPSGTFGFYRPEQHEPQSHFTTAAASSPAIAATLKSLDENSLQHLRDRSVPNVCTYSPTVNGQFPRAYTMKEILAERKRTALQRNLVKNDDVPQELHLALGPGSYDANQDTNQEKIATPFTFSHEKRHGILENTATLGRLGCSPGPVYRVESSSAVSSASTVANAPFRSKHATAFITRVRSDSQLHQQQKKDAAMYSKELAKSYQQLGASVERLGKRLASPGLREQTFRRFDKDFTGLESYRRGPGSYNSGDNSQQGEDIKSADWYELSPLRTTGRKPNCSFGRVASRDLLTSMIAAGHASASTIGPGIYDAHSSSFVVPTHNIGYKQQTNPKPRKRASSSEAADATALSQREMWKVMRQGPSLPS